MHGRIGAATAVKWTFNQLWGDQPDGKTLNFLINTVWLSHQPGGSGLPAAAATQSWIRTQWGTLIERQLTDWLNQLKRYRNENCNVYVIYFDCMHFYYGMFSFLEEWQSVDKQQWKKHQPLCKWYTALLRHLEGMDGEQRAHLPYSMQAAIHSRMSVNWCVISNVSSGSVVQKSLEFSAGRIVILGLLLQALIGS